MARELFSLPPLSRLSFSLLPLSRLSFSPLPLLSLFTFRLLPILSPPPSTLTIPIYLYPIHLPLSSPSAPLFPFRPQPILSPPPSALTLPIYTHSLLPLASLFTPVPCLFPLPSPSDERDEGYPILLMGRRGGAGDSHIPLTPPRGKSEGRDRNKIPEATYPLWGTSPRVYLWGRVRTWGNGGYFFAFFIPSR